MPPPTTAPAFQDDHRARLASSSRKQGVQFGQFGVGIFPQAASCGCPRVRLDALDDGENGFHFAKTVFVSLTVYLAATPSGARRSSEIDVRRRIAMMAPGLQPTLRSKRAVSKSGWRDTSKTSLASPYLTSLRPLPRGGDKDDVPGGNLQNLQSCIILNSERPSKLLDYAKPVCRACDGGLHPS
jgi:hypothetical protein